MRRHHASSASKKCSRVDHSTDCSAIGDIGDAGHCRAAGSGDGIDNFGHAGDTDVVDNNL